MAPLCFLWSTSGGNYRCDPVGVVQNTAGASGGAWGGGAGGEGGERGQGRAPQAPVVAGVWFPHHEEIVWPQFWDHKIPCEAKERDEYGGSKIKWEQQGTAALAGGQWDSGTGPVRSDPVNVPWSGWRWRAEAPGFIPMSTGSDPVSTIPSSCIRKQHV